jgi:hypothetical protein
LGGQGYMGEEMFVMRRLGRWELAPRHDLEAVHAYNKMHEGYKLRVEWGIWRFQAQMEKLMKRFDYTKPKYNHLFRVVVILINFLHNHHLNFIIEIIGNHITDPSDYV